MDKGKRKLLIALILIVFFLGFESGGFQLVLTIIGQEYGLTDGEMGRLVGVQFLAIAVFPILLGRISDKVSKKTILLIFIGVFILGTVVVTLPYTILLMAGIFIIGAGYSVCESTVSAVLAQEYPQDTAKYQNLAQAFLSMGAMISPLINGFLINGRGLNWRLPFVICGVSYLCIILLLKTVTIKSKSTNHIKAAAPYRILINPVFILLGVAMLFCVALENGGAYFAGILFADFFHKPEFTSAAISLFWLGTILSRILVTIFSKYAKKIAVAAFLGLAVALMLVTVVSAKWGLPLYLLIGFFIGPIWPIIMSFATNEYPNDTGFVSGVLMSTCGLGGAASSTFMGAVSQKYGIKNGFLFLSLLALLGAVVHMGYLFLNRKKNSCY